MSDDAVAEERISARVVISIDLAEMRDGLCAFLGSHRSGWNVQPTRAPLSNVIVQLSRACANDGLELTIGLYLAEFSTCYQRLAFALTNNRFRDRVRHDVDYAIQEAQSAALENAPGLTGRIREIAVTRLFRPLLSSGCFTGTGLVVDSYGRESRQTDLVIYSNRLLPSVMFNENEGIFPAEACLYCVEIKSRTSADEIRDAIAKGRRIGELQYRSGMRGQNGREIPHFITQIIPALFAFDSDLSPNGMTELERYRELDVGGIGLSPSIQVICVVSRGYWYRSGRGWVEHPPSRDHDEVIDFLSGVINTIPDQIASRGHPVLGHYLMVERETRTIE